MPGRTGSGAELVKWFEKNADKLAFDAETGKFFVKDESKKETTGE